MTHRKSPTSGSRAQTCIAARNSFAAVARLAEENLTGADLYRVAGACLLSDSAIRVCQAVPLAFPRVSTSGGTRRLIATLECGDFGWPRGLSISAAVFSPNNFGRTWRAGRARLKSTAVHSGFSLIVRFYP